MNGDNELLSLDALAWLKSINYSEKRHEERMALIKAARIAYPNKEDESEIERFKRSIGLA